MAAENNRDLIEAMIAPRPRRRPAGPTAPSTASAIPLSEAPGEAPKSADEPTAPESPAEPEPAPAEAPKAAKISEAAKNPDLEGRLEVRPIGTSLGLRELAALHRRTWSNLNVQEKRVHMLLWPLALHFGLYQVRAGGSERRRPPLIGAFWARCLAEAPLTLGHLYPPQLFRGLMASDVYEFGGMVIDPTYQGKGLVKMMSDTAKLFLFSRRPKLIITNPVEPLYELYKQLGLKAIGRGPIEHPHATNVKVWLMYGKFEELAKPYYM
jgi:hypothetical protein